MSGRSDSGNLNAFIADNAALNELERRLARFNIFEAIGAARHELRHSDFLAFLLDPRASHGLGGAFLRQLLDTVLTSPPAVYTPISRNALNSLDYRHVTVQREWQHIDILVLIRDDQHHLAILIENKVNIDEGLDQLARYYERTKRHYPSYAIVPVYLTPDGRPPRDQKSPYVPVDYKTISNLLEIVLRDSASDRNANPDATRTIEHYIQMLRRRIVGDDETAELCRQIWHDHQPALDILYQYRPDQKATIRDILLRLVEQEPEEFAITYKEKMNFTVFRVKRWDTLKQLQRGTEGPMLVFAIDHWTRHAPSLQLQIGPGPKDIQRRLSELASDPKNQPLFHSPKPTRNVQYCRIYTKALLEVPYGDISPAELDVEISRHWSEFTEGKDFADICRVIEGQEWLQECT